MRSNRSNVTGGIVVTALLATYTLSAQVSLVITSVVASADRTTLVIRGTNMCADPVVTLGGTKQAVTSADASLVTISYPDVESGSYRLLVSCGPAPGRWASFDVDISRRR
jgi:hypothetical protein